MKAALIGMNIKNSLSKNIHLENGLTEFDYLDINKTDLKLHIKEYLDEYSFINVTYPFKEEILNYVDVKSDDVINLQSCNLIFKKDNIVYGYNTDVDGVYYMFNKHCIEPTDKKVLIFGTGATSRTITYCLNKLNVKQIDYVSRSSSVLNYETIKTMNLDYDLVINATPKNVLDDYFNNTKLNFVGHPTFIDVNYNDGYPVFLRKQLNTYCHLVNGLAMLIGQALKVYDYLGVKTMVDPEQLYETLFRNSIKIVFIGMPYAGKTTICKTLGNKYNLKYIDTDELVVEMSHQTIKEIFLNNGEKGFRTMEKAALLKVINSNIPLISIGGGAIVHEEEMKALKKDHIFIYLRTNYYERFFDNTRPLLKNMDSYTSLYEARKNTYLNLADMIVSNEISQNIIEIIERRLNL